MDSSRFVAGVFPIKDHNGRRDQMIRCHYFLAAKEPTMSEPNLFLLLGIPDEPEPSANTPPRRPRGRPPGRSIVGRPAQQSTVSALKLFLLDQFEGYRDRRVKKPASDGPIKIDERGSGDAPCLFCDISASFPDPAIDSFGGVQEILPGVSV